MTPQHIIEAALLSSRRPMPVREIRRLFDDRLSAKSVKEHLAELQAFWEDRGMRLVELSDGWRFQTASELGPRFLRLDEEKPPRYSRAAMETLAIIAYHQPVTRGDIEELRGVTVNPAHPQALRGARMDRDGGLSGVAGQAGASCHDQNFFK